MSLYTKLILIFAALFIIALAANLLFIKFYYWGDKTGAPKKNNETKET